MSVKISAVAKGSAAERKRIYPGDTLVAINGNEIFDVLDYRFYGDADEVYLDVINSRGSLRKKHIRHLDGVDSLGLEFDTYLMDKKQRCRNKCVFCFVDQMPPHMRESLYFKDDDSRLSFFFGNYITLTAISEREVQRIIDMHISPINISVHTMNPDLRVKMMGNPHAGDVLHIIDRLSDAGIRMNTQLVLCPGLNDGDELRYSLDELSKRYPEVQSIAAVPVGLTAHRDGLHPLVPYDRDSARATLDIIDEFNAHFEYFNGFRLCYPADEFFIKAERQMPDAKYYGEFSQLENGVGMWALLKSSFAEALESFIKMDYSIPDDLPCIATGDAAFSLLSELMAMLHRAIPAVTVPVYRIRNDFFGESVTVAGLITGKDLIGQLKKQKIGRRLLLTSAMMKSADEKVFLDDLTVADVEKTLGVTVEIVPETDGESLLYTIFRM